VLFCNTEDEGERETGVIGQGLLVLFAVFVVVPGIAALYDRRLP